MSGRIVVGPKGAEVNFVSEQGEVLRTLHLPPGVHSTHTFEKLRGAGERVAYSIPPLVPRGVTARIRSEGHWQSSANPAFRVSASQRQAKNLQMMMRRTEGLARAAQKAVKAAQRAQKAVPQIEAPKETSVKPDESEVSAT